METSPRPIIGLRREIDRIRSEYEEMPGLNLTLRQAPRFWQLEPGKCESLLELLVRDGFLAHSRSGYVRLR